MVSRLEKHKEEIVCFLNEGKTLKELSEIYGFTRVQKFKESAIKCGIIPMKNGEYYSKPEYKCPYCDKVFDSNQKLGGHVNFCEEGPNRSKNLSVLCENRKNANHIKKGEILSCKFCGKEVNGKGCLALHEKSCKENPNRIKRNVTSKGKSHTAWNKGKTAKDDERVLKAAIKRRKTLNEDSYDRTVLSHKHTESTKQLLREKMIEYIKQNGNGSFGQRYSVKGCLYIDKLNKDKGWNLVHAMNGGELEVCGYFLDGYDEKLNIAFEYDEPHHYENVYENKLNKKDIERQEVIKKYLGCEFYRYNEKMDVLYKV